MGQPKAWLSSKPRLAYNLSARTTQKTQLFHCCPTVALLSISCLATGVVPLFVSRPLPSNVSGISAYIGSLHSNGSTRYNMLQHHVNNRPQFYSGNRENAFAEYQDVCVCVCVYMFFPTTYPAFCLLSPCCRRTCIDRSITRRSEEGCGSDITRQWTVSLLFMFQS
jgi:hypothetical protein